ncbi:MAG TPA: GH25 family lysozyme [Flavobacterium sp.]|jgi:lysozyme
MAKRVVRRKSSAKYKNPSSFFRLFRKLFFIIVFSVLLVIVIYHYRNGIAYYLGFKAEKQRTAEEDKKIADIRNYQILSKHTDKVIGFDISEYQGKIKWDKIKYADGNFPLDFVLIRATAGKNKVDNKFRKNWTAAKDKKIIRGAYHYYRPDENSLAQALLFIKTVQLRPGDLPPVLDIEKLPRDQSLDNLITGLKRWMDKIESYYGVKPIIYSGDSYYSDFLEEEFKGYTFWIANYNILEEKINKNWKFWQFTEKGTVKGIKGNVDLNIFNGNKTQLKFLTIGN